MFDFFDARKEVELGRELAGYVIEAVAAAAELSKDKKRSKKEIALYDRISKRIELFRTTAKLNFFKKARMANVFKWTLLENGFSSTAVNELTKFVLLQLK